VRRPGQGRPVEAEQIRQFNDEAYGMAGHFDGLGRLGPLAVHRCSFATVWIVAGANDYIREWEVRGSIEQPGDKREFLPHPSSPEGRR
jgi:hypothetical protein